MGELIMSTVHKSFTLKAKIFLFLLTVFCASCYFKPTPVYLLKPQLQEGYWLWGKYFQVKQTDSLEVALAYDRSYEGYYKFNIIIKNNTRKPVLVDPVKFYYQLVWLTSEGPRINRIYAVDPEKEIIKLAKQESREIAAYRTDSANRALLAFFDLLGDLSDSGKNSANNLQNEVSSLRSNLEHQVQMQSIEKKLKQWKVKALRKTTLPPNFQITGDVFFPVKSEIEKIIIHVVVNGKEFLFPFKQYVEN